MQQVVSDPLTILREAIINKIPIVHNDNHYSIGNHTFEENIKTCFKRTLKGVDSDYYKLRDVVFFIENSELPIAEYRRKVLTAKVVTVVEKDSKDLKEYLTGIIDSCPQLDYSAAAAFISQAKVDHEESIKLQGPTLTTHSNTQETSNNLQEITEIKKKHKDISGKTIDHHVSSADAQMLAKIRTNEYPSQNRNSVCSFNNTDFSFVLKLYNDVVLREKVHGEESSKLDTRKLDPNIISSTVKPASQVIKDTRIPIIIVPSALTSCITTINSLDFFENGQYTFVEDKLKSGSKREQEVTITRILPGPDKKTVEYKIIDNHRMLRKSDWDRVVAVFASGQSWQFKDWKWSNPVELFHHVLGVHLTMDDRSFDPIIQSWNCKILKVYRFKRHLDAEAVNEFWAMLDEFIKLRKPEFMR